LFAAKGKSAEICSPVDRMNCGLLGQQPINRHPVLLIPQLLCPPCTHVILSSIQKTEH